MRRKHSIRRRTFLGASLAAVSGAAISCGRSGTATGFRFFTAAEAATVDAICEALIPSDERDPGAHAARAVNYIDIQLMRHFSRFRPVYRQGIAAVEAASRAKFSKPFTAVTAEERAEVLTEIEEKSKEFFDLVLTHTRQGFYGDPRHGGNRGMVSWKMVGLAFPQVRGRMHYDEGPKVS